MKSERIIKTIGTALATIFAVVTVFILLAGIQRFVLTAAPGKCDSIKAGGL